MFVCTIIYRRICIITIIQYAWIKCYFYTSLNNSNTHSKLSSSVKYSRKWKISPKSSSVRCRHTISRRIDAVELNINMRQTLSWNIHNRYVEKGDTLKQHLAVLLEQIKINFIEGPSKRKNASSQKTYDFLCAVNPSQCRYSGINRCLVQCICICMNIKWVCDVCSFWSHSLSHSIGPFFEKKRCTEVETFHLHSYCCCDDCWCHYITLSHNFLSFW